MKFITITIDKLKLTSLFLLAWYAIIRWTMLSLSNPESQNWLADPFGNVLAFFSIGYLVYTIIIVNPQQNKTYGAITILMVLLNIYCLYDMTKIFITDTSPINFGYEMLDIFILLHYTLLMCLCFMTNKNTTFCSQLRVRIVGAFSKMFKRVNHHDMVSR